MQITLYIEGTEMETMGFHKPARKGDVFSLAVPHAGSMVRTYRVTLVDKNSAIAEAVRTETAYRTYYHETCLEE